MATQPGMPMASPSARRAGSGLRLRVLLPLLGVVIAAVWLMHRPSKPSKPALLPEVLRSELVLREGRLYQNQGTNPFLGFMVEFYQTNLLQSRSMVSNGLLQGLSEGWHTNGQLQVREFFNEGVSHGVRTKWYPDGARMSEGTIVAGKHQGTFRRWHENGRLAEEIEMRDGKPEGLSRSFYPSGFLKAQARMTNGQVADQKFWPDGENAGH
jgi:antitoxin component YwqK of YwqJK toxin-antitoxin module